MCAGAAECFDSGGAVDVPPKDVHDNLPLDLLADLAHVDSDPQTEVIMSSERFLNLKGADYGDARLSENRKDSVSGTRHHGSAFRLLDDLE